MSDILKFLSGVDRAAKWVALGAVDTTAEGSTPSVGWTLSGSSA